MTPAPQPGSGHTAQAPSKAGRARVPSVPRAVPSARRRALLATQIVAPVVLLAIWWFASARSTDPFFPPLQQIVQRFGQLWFGPNLVTDVFSSVGNLLLSFAIAVVLGVGLGILLSLSRTLSAMLDPVLHFSRAIPGVAIVPIIVSVFGFGNETRIIAIVLAAVFPTLIATVDGLRSVDPLVRDVSRVFQVPTAERLFRIDLPSAAPRIAAGIHVSLQISFAVMIASEMLGSSTGIGAKTLLAQQSFAIADMWSGILLLGIIGFAANAIFELVERRALAWYFGYKGAGKDS